MTCGLELNSAAFHDRRLAASSSKLHLLYSKSVVSVDSISHVASIITAPEELITSDWHVVRVILLARHRLNLKIEHALSNRRFSGTTRL